MFYDFWGWYRIILGATLLLYLLPLGCFLIGFGARLTDTTRRALEQPKGHWDKDFDLLPGGVLSSGANGITTRDLAWPPIPVKERPSTDTIYPWPSFTSHLFIGVGLVTIALSFLGAYTVYNETPIFIILFTALMTVFVLIQFLFAFLHFSIDLKPLQDMKESLRTSLLNEYEVGAKAHNHFTFSLNRVMLTWNCCGVAGPADFLVKDYTYVWKYTNSDGLKRKKLGDLKGGEDNTTFYRKVKFPLACCKAETRMRGFETLLHCAASGDERLINNKGCFSTVFENLFHTVGDKAVDTFFYIIGCEVEEVTDDKRTHYIMYLFTSTNTASFMCLLSVILIILVTILANIPRDYETEAARIVLERANTLESQTAALVEKAMEENEAILKAMGELERMSQSPEQHTRRSSDKQIRTNLNRRHVFVPYAKVEEEESETSTQIW